MWLLMPRYITARGITRLKCNRLVCITSLNVYTYASYSVVTRRATLCAKILLHFIGVNRQKKRKGVGGGTFDNSRSIASFCRATSPCPLFTRHLLPRRARCLWNARFILSNPPHFYSNLTLSLSVVKTKSKFLCIIKL